jgi:hypothetical protein
LSEPSSGEICSTTSVYSAVIVMLLYTFCYNLSFKTMSCAIQMLRDLGCIRQIGNTLGEFRVSAVSLSVYQSEQRTFSEEF